MTDAQPPVDPAPEDAPRPWYTQPAFLVALVVLIALVILLFATGTARTPLVMPTGEPDVQPTDPAVTDPPEEVTAEPAPSPTDGRPAPPQVETDEGPAPHQVSGSGTVTTGPLRHEGGLAIIRASHEGDGALVLTLLSPDGEEQPLTAAEGDYQGARGLGLEAGDYRVRVETEGAWDLSWEQPRYVTGLQLPQLLEGRADTVSEPFTTAGGKVRFEWDAEGEEDLVITVLTAAGEPAGELSGPGGGAATLELGEGLYVLDVTAVDVWRITVS